MAADELKALALAVLDVEADAIRALAPQINDRFVEACRLLLTCTGRIVVTGIGKSGHIGHKLAATLASTGSPAFFVHAAEASHGDLGMLQRGDVVIAISNSGNSAEITALMPGIKRLGIDVISLTGEPESPLARAATVNVHVGVEREACPLGLAPTASTTATLAMGDALAIALLGSRGFNETDFALSHPGGRLGRRLLLHVSDVMASGTALPKVSATVPLSDALMEITQKGLGMVTIVDAHNQLLGIFTDGDLRRSLDRQDDIRTVPIGDVMTRGGHVTAPDALAFSAVETMQTHRITALPVIESEQLVGVVTMHALLTAGVV